MYSDDDDGDWVDVNGNKVDANVPVVRTDARRATVSLNRNDCGELVKSDTEGSISDPFHYDNKYSACNQMLERDISKALRDLDPTPSYHHSVNPFDKHQPQAFRRHSSFYNLETLNSTQHHNNEVKVPVLRPSEGNANGSHRLSKGGQHALTIDVELGARSESATDGDWQTVTTNQAQNPSSNSGTFVFKGATSSLADVSDRSDHEYQNYEESGRIVHHPQHGAGLGPSYIRTEKTSNKPILFSNQHGPGALAFPQDSCRQPRSTGGRAGGAFRRLSRHLVPDVSPKRRHKRNQAIEMDIVRSSYGTLGSASDSDDTVDAQREGVVRIGFDQGELPRLHPPHEQKSKRTPAKTSVLRKPDPVHPAQVAATMKQQVPCLPFPLVSLPEAANRQQFRRQFGEEDHTEPASSFIARARSRTLSTITSSRTPTYPPPVARAPPSPLGVRIIRDQEGV